MRQIKEMNKLEIEGAKSLMRKHGWKFCQMGFPEVKAWTKDGITIEESQIWFDE